MSDAVAKPAKKNFQTPEDKAEIAAIRDAYQGDQRVRLDDLYTEIRHERTKWEREKVRSVLDYREAERRLKVELTIKSAHTVCAGAKTDAESYLEMDRAAQGKTASDATDWAWVKNRLKMPLSEIDLATIPSPSAVVKLDWARSNTNRFCEMMMPRQGARGEESANGGDVDTGKSILDTIAEIERIGYESVSALDPEGAGTGAVQGNLGLPSANDPGGLSK